MQTIDKLPPIMMYSNFLQKASTRFNLTISECRSLYGQYSIKEWNALLNNN